METMMLMPMAVAAVPAARHALPSSVNVPETFGALPTTAAAADSCIWSSTTNGMETRHAATKARQAFGSRRLEEPPT